MLNDITIRNAKPREKIYSLFDGPRNVARGLYLEVSPGGSKLWRCKYRFGGKPRLLSLGTYPDVGLKEARGKRDGIRKQVAAGVDPSAARKAAKTARGGEDSLEAIAREWHDTQASGWGSEYAAKVKGRLERHVFPWLGTRPTAEIEAPELLTVLRRIEARGTLELAHRVHQYLGQVFGYAIITKRAQRDPAADLRRALKPISEKHHAAITDPKEIGALLRAIGGFRGSFVTQCALRLTALTFVRSGELRKAEWSEFDLDAAEWQIPAERMKRTRRKTPVIHMVPLSVQAVGILRELHPVTGTRRYVFPGLRTPTRPMSENTVNAALRRLGYTKDEMTGHGFRAMARTVIDEELGVRPDFIEHQLAHTVRDPLGRAYNRTKHLVERWRMMQAWADYLDGLKTGAEIVPLHALGA